jgi:predicted DsbA family dithiol-disulfide isomerase
VQSVSGTPTARVRLDVWSDYVCPFCYLELPAIDRLREEMGQDLLVEWHAFELRPDPLPTLEPAGEYLRTTWARSVYPMAAERGMRLVLPPVQPRSRKAFETAEFAREHGRFDAVHHALFRAFFEEGRDIGEVPVLLDVGAAAGLDPLKLADALAGNRYTARVIEDEKLAQRLGISGVPALLARPMGQPVERSRGLSGAVPYAQLKALVANVS